MELDKKLDGTRENAEGIVRRLEKGTKIFKGNEVPLTKAQIKRRKDKLDEQNLKLLFFGLPIIRVKQSGQVGESEVE
jgi:hypothetical protein